MTVSFVFSVNTLISIIFLLAVCQNIVGCNIQEQPAPEEYVIGLITNNPNGLRNVQGFRDGLQALGYAEGKSLKYISSQEPVAKNDLNSALQEMVTKEVDLIFTAGTPTGVAAYQVTKDTGIPVVFGVIADPVASGVMLDLTHPGGNITGVKLSQNQDRRLELLLDIAPNIKKIFIPYNPGDIAATSSVEQIRKIANHMNVTLIEGKVTDSDQLASLLERFPDDADAIFLVPDSTVNRHIKDIVRVSYQRKIPLSGPSTIQTEGGALTAYGIVHHEAGVQAARIAHRIMKGEYPGDIPVETAESFLSINLNTAKNIGLELTDEVIEQADYIIRND